MKLKQLLSGIITGAIALSSVVLPSSAATTRAASVTFAAPQTQMTYNLTVNLSTQAFTDWTGSAIYDSTAESITVPGLYTGASVYLRNGTSTTVAATIEEAYMGTYTRLQNPDGRVTFSSYMYGMANNTMPAQAYNRFAVTLVLKLSNTQHGVNPSTVLGNNLSTLQLTTVSGSGTPYILRSLCSDGSATPNVAVNLPSTNLTLYGTPTVGTSYERPYLKTGTSYPVYSSTQGTPGVSGSYLTIPPSGFVHYGNTSTGNDYYYNSSSRQYFNRVNDPYNYVYYNETTKQYLYPYGYNNSYLGGGSSSTTLPSNVITQLPNNGAGYTYGGTGNSDYYTGPYGVFNRVTDPYGYSNYCYYNSSTRQYYYPYGFTGTGTGTGSLGSYSTYTVITYQPTGYYYTNGGYYPTNTSHINSYDYFRLITDPSGYGYACYANDYTRVLYYPNGAPSNIGSGSYNTQQTFSLTATQAASLLKGQDFNVTLTLADTSLSTSNGVFRFATNLGTAGITAYTNYYQRTVTFTNIPASYFFSSNGLLFSSFTVYSNASTYYATSNVLDYESVVINYNEVTPDETTTTTTTTTPDEDEPTEPAEDELSVNFTELTLNVGASAYLDASEDVTWSKLKSGGSNIKIYTNGKVTGVTAGTGYVRARNADGDLVQIKVTVKSSSKPRTSFALTTKSGTVYTGSAYSLAKYNSSPSGTTDTISWASSDPYVATVDKNGKVTINNVGTVTITALTSSGLTSSCRLTAKNPSITLSATSGSVKVGGTYSIKATAKPSSSRLTYEAINESIAKVSASGVITGVSTGTTKIQISSNKGVIRIFTITVTK
jgi:hypothetical protein